MTTIPAYLNNDPLFYAGLIQLYRRGTVRVLEKGAELESFLIGEILEQGLTPYGQIITDNRASRALQEKLGLKILDRVITRLY